MKTQSPDTVYRAEQVQIDPQRKLNTSQKIEQVRSLSALVMRLSRRAIVRARRPSNEIEANLLFVELHYGEELARGLREYLQKNRNDGS